MKVPVPSWRSTVSRSAFSIDAARGSIPSSAATRRPIDACRGCRGVHRRTAPATPWPSRRVIGHFVGAKTATAFVRQHPDLAQLLVLVTPGFFPRVGMTLLTRLRILWARVSSPTRQFPIPLSAPELFTATPKWLDFLRQDPLALHQATARFLVESVRLDRSLRDVPAQHPAPHTPLARRPRSDHRQRTDTLVRRALRRPRRRPGLSASASHAGIRA